MGRRPDTLEVPLEGGGWVGIGFPPLSYALPYYTEEL